MNIRLDPADIAFSKAIRLRDGKCMRCGSMVRLNLEGMPASHTTSHYFGRGNENTRFDPENCDCLCLGCHQIWASKDREDYRLFKIAQLGEEGFESLFLRSKHIVKKDRKMALIQSREFLKAAIAERI